MSARPHSGIDPSTGPTMTLKPRLTGYIHSNYEKKRPNRVRCGVPVVWARKNSSSPAVTVTLSVTTSLSMSCSSLSRSSLRSHRRRCNASMKRKIMWYSSDSVPGCSRVAPRQPGKPRTVSASFSDAATKDADVPGLIVRAMVTVTAPAAICGSFAVSKDPVSSGMVSPYRAAVPGRGMPNS